MNHPLVRRLSQVVKSRRDLGSLVGSALAVGTLGTQALATASERPPPAPITRPAPSGGTGTRCHTWTGSSQGDFGLMVSTELCGDDDHVTGTIRFADATQSVTVRRYTGGWVEGHTRLVMYQTGILRAVLSPEWTQARRYWCTTRTVYAFQLVDRTHLTGTYSSPDCDSGTLSLQAR